MPRRLLLPSRRTSLFDYALAVAAVAGIACVRGLLERAGLIDQAPFVLFALPVVLASWRGGFGPGALATVLGALVVDYFFLAPRFSIQVGGPREVLPLLLFLLQGLLIGFLGRSNRRLFFELEQARTQLEQRVVNRTSELETAVSALIQQVGDNREINDSLRDYSGQLERSNRELQDFASVASHDLQEPLRKIQAFGDRLRTRCSAALGEEGLDYLARMQNAAGRMQVLINDLLTFSRVTTQARPFQPVDLSAVVEQVVSDLEVRLDETGGRIEFDSLPVVEADPLQMRQLFQNLLSNGLKFRRDGVPPVVRIRSRSLADRPCEEGAEPCEECEIEVQDNGIGFDEKYLDRIFQIFQRLHGRAAYEGTGIGLAVCRKIVERHGGEITARSRPEVGSTFVVRLPLRHSLAEPRSDGAEENTQADYHSPGR